MKLSTIIEFINVILIFVIVFTWKDTDAVGSVAALDVQQQAGVDFDAQLQTTGAAHFYYATGLRIPHPTGLVEPALRPSFPHATGLVEPPLRPLGTFHSGVRSSTSALESASSQQHLQPTTGTHPIQTAATPSSAFGALAVESDDNNDQLAEINTPAAESESASDSASFDATQFGGGGFPRGFPGGQGGQGGYGGYPGGYPGGQQQQSGYGYGYGYGFSEEERRRRRRR